MLGPLAIFVLMAVELSRTATIIDSGSTNRPGFRIVVDPSGDAEFTWTPKRFGQLLDSQPQQQQPIRKRLPRAVIERFQADLKAAKPLASLPAVHCMKSVSFGSTLAVAFGEEQTPDLSCGDGGNQALRNLIRDAREIVALLEAK